MKKIVFLLLVITGLFAAKATAQSATRMPIAAGDTISTSATLDTVTKIFTATGPYHTLGLQVVTTKVSGTVAGKAYVYSSLDGTNYTLTDSSGAFTDITTNTAFFTKTSVPYTYYKVELRSATGAPSTQINAVKVYYVFRRSYP